LEPTEENEGEAMHSLIVVDVVDVEQSSQSVLKVLGVVSYKGFPEPAPIDSVEVRVDNGAGVDATFGPVRKQGAVFSRKFSAELQRPPLGDHVVFVTATNDRGFSETKAVSYSG
jgi:hypothetical protein